MQKNFFVLFFCLIALNVFSKGTITFSGSYESIFDFAQWKKYTYNDYGVFSWGWNNYANLRMKADINEYLAFDMAFNINSFTGNYTENYKLSYRAFSQSVFQSLQNNSSTGNSFLSIPFYYKDSYVGNLELERMYFNTGNDYFSIKAGLLRMSHGFDGFTFKPMDFINPPNPINKTTRPEGRLTFISTFYPMPLWEIELFMVAPDNPIEEAGWGFKFGADAKINLKKVQMEFLYTLFLPEIEYHKNPVELNLPAYINNDFSHLIGFGIKADVEVGLKFEITYRFDQGQLKNLSYYGKEFYLFRGLNASIGIDYTVLVPNTDSKFYFMIDYFFSGSGVIDWNEKNLDGLFVTQNWKKYNPYNRAELIDMEKPQQIFVRHDYLSGLIRYTINSYVSISGTYLFGIDDQSSLLGWIIEVEPFQSFTITINGSYPFGWEMIKNNWNAGEFGSTNLGYFQDYRISAKLKF